MARLQIAPIPFIRSKLGWLLHPPPHPSPHPPPIPLPRQSSLSNHRLLAWCMW
ncbi:hypothetical protein HYALB_00005304 [Hymenoscyphus albidus]|uniref:Uncharacterized protein n=1 Tax=Hymenoscyphus albidus TaxID=595503 RepID=A0A9N9QBP5_9HELO|nr:hypothetical protein HYALB_00005304 [Hymenoscyphus albidus]